MSVQEISERSKYWFVGRLTVSIIIEDLMAKDAVYQGGFFQSYSGKREVSLVMYAAKIRFSDYYAEKFKTISPHNLFSLTEDIINSDSLSPDQLQSLSTLIDEKMKSWEL